MFSTLWLLIFFLCVFIFKVGCCRQNIVDSYWSIHRLSVTVSMRGVNLPPSCLFSIFSVEPLSLTTLFLPSFGLLVFHDSIVSALLAFWLKFVFVFFHGDFGFTVCVLNASVSVFKSCQTTSPVVQEPYDIVTPSVFFLQQCPTPFPFCMCFSFKESILFKKLLFFNYSWHTLLHEFQVCSMMVKHLYILGSDFPNKSSPHLTP